MNILVDVPELFKVVEEDKFGNIEQVPFDAVPAWSLVDASFGSLAPSADGLSCVLTSAGKVGATSLQFSGSIGGQVFAGSLALNFLPGAVSQVVIQDGGPAPAAAPVAPAAPAS